MSPRLRRWVARLAVATLGWGAAWAQAQPVAPAPGPRPEAFAGWAVGIPPTWELRQNAMGVDWMARPALSQDEEGWGQDLLVVAHQPRPPGQGLRAAAAASLQAIGHHASEFKVLAQRDVRQGKHVARWVHLRMKDGPERREGQLLVLLDGPRVLTLLATTSPQRHASRSAAFSAMVGVRP